MYIVVYICIYLYIGICEWCFLVYIDMCCHSSCITKYNWLNYYLKYLLNLNSSSLTSGQLTYLTTITQPHTMSPRLTGDRMGSLQAKYMFTTMQVTYRNIHTYSKMRYIDPKAIL